uniref:Putative structural polyprotein n=1 Tax=Solenopsis invicta virus 6 TaxID=2547312 RepID=A0A482CH37_9VIRU|nr:putative structural polyprotein [Solenopsis invicta virus 6]
MRVQVNAQPFQAGRLIIAWIPYFKYLGTNRTDFWSSDTEQSMVSVSSLPHVEIDLSQCTEGVLNIPYVSPQLYYNLVTGEGYYGKLFIKIYSPLVDPSGSGKVDCTVWFNFENVDLAFPTGLPVASSSLNPIAQVGKEEREMEETGSVSSALSKFSTALKPLVAIPTLTEIVQPVCWASDTASAIAKLFGYSKPDSTNTPSFFKQNPCRFMANYDGVNTSHKLMLASDGDIEAMPDMIATRQDEMAISHIAATPSYLTSYTWSTSNAYNTEIFNLAIHPMNFVSTNTTNNTVAPTMIAYVSAPFTFWRGTVDITFKFVKTKFHSGRLRIFYQPGSTSVFNTGRANYNYSQVVDLRSETQVVFRVPYVNTKSWLSLRELNFASGNLLDIPGIVHVQVLNELVANTSVSSSIDVLVEVSAGPDYELAGPSQPLLQAVSISSTTSFARRILDKTRARAQVGEDIPREDDQGVVNKDQFGKQDQRMFWSHNLAMIGEKVTSVRQLIKRFSNIGTFQTNNNIIRLNPFKFNHGYSRTATAPISIYEQSLLDYYSLLFGFYRGSINFKLLNTSLLNYNIKAELRTNSFYTADWTFLSNGFYDNTIEMFAKTGGPAQVIVTALEGCVDITVPFYSLMHMCPVTSMPFNLNNVDLGLFPSEYVTLTGVPNATDFQIFRAAGDSFQFGYLLAPPLCERTNASSS